MMGSYLRSLHFSTCVCWRYGGSMSVTPCIHTPLMYVFFSLFCGSFLVWILYMTSSESSWPSCVPFGSVHHFRWGGPDRRECGRVEHEKRQQQLHSELDTRSLLSSSLYPFLSSLSLFQSFLPLPRFGYFFCVMILFSLLPLWTHSTELSSLCSEKHEVIASSVSENRKKTWNSLGSSVVFEVYL